jgi:3-deoxy-D-manno-octulosonic-acid transferase
VTDHIPRRFKDIPPRAASRQCLWVHGVSVGEVLSVRHFLRLFSQEFPDWEIVISATTRSGIEAGRRHYPSTQIFSYPFDFSYLVKRAFDRVRPDLVIIVEHELWPNFLWHAQARGVPVAIVNGRLSQRSLRGYRWLSRVDTWPPPGVVTICVEDDVSAAAFRKLGVSPEAIRVTGNFKFDNIPKASSGVREELGFNGADWVLVAASTHQGEEKLLLDAFGALHKEDKRSRLVLAPRRVERIDKLAGLIEERGFRPLRWSKHPARSSAQNGHGEVLLVDTVGELDKITQAADVVFVGGSLVPFGGHNIIAPAGIGRPVVIGPHYTNFRSIVSTFLDREALLVAKDGGDLSRKLQDLKNDPGRARGMARRAVEAVAENAGASERTIEALRPLVQSIDARSKVEV